MDMSEADSFSGCISLYMSARKRYAIREKNICTFIFCGVSVTYRECNVHCVNGSEAVLNPVPLDKCSSILSWFISGNGSSTVSLRFSDSRYTLALSMESELSESMIFLALIIAFFSHPDQYNRIHRNPPATVCQVLFHTCKQPLWTSVFLYSWNRKV